MKQITRLLWTAAVLSCFTLVAGCGGGGDDSDFRTERTQLSSSQVTAAPTGSPAGSIAVANQPIIAYAPHQTGQTANTKVMALFIPANTTITPAAGDTFTTANPPEIRVSIPDDNATYARADLPMISPPGGTPFRVASSKGAVDISFEGTESFTLSQPATVNIPVNAVLTNPVTVYKVKWNGATTVLSGTYGLDSNGNKIVTVNGGITDFCVLIAEPEPVTGSSGGN